MRVVAFAALAVAASAAAQVQIGVDNPLRTGENQQAAVRVNDAIYLAYGFGNTFLVTTSAGNVVIDTSSVIRAPRAKELLQRENAGPIKYIVLTHGDEQQLRQGALSLEIELPAAAVSPLRTVAVTRYVTPLREGGSVPAIVEADDDGMFAIDGVITPL